MKNSKIAQRYSKAILSLAEDKTSLDAVAADFKSLQALIESSKDLESFFRNPLIPSAKQIDILEALLKKKVNPLTLVSLKFLAERKKFKFLPQICKEIEKLHADMRGILKVWLTSAVAMSQEQIRAISEKLQARFGKTIEAQTQVDPALLGGFKVSVGDMIYDLSVKSKLDEFRQKVLTA